MPERPEPLEKGITYEPLLRRISTCSIALSLALPCAFAQKEQQKRLEEAGMVMQQILNAPDNIPRTLLDHAKCVVVLPSVVKAAFGVGGGYGHGAMVCRTGPNFDEPWGPPAMYSLEGGSFGFQIDGQATDIVSLHRECTKALYSGGDREFPGAIGSLIHAIAHRGYCRCRTERGRKSTR